MVIGAALAVIVAAAVVWFLLGAAGYDGRRRQAIGRIAFGVPFLLLTATIGFLFAAYIVLVFAADVLYQLLTGRGGLSSSGNAGRLFEYREQNVKWVMFGDGEPRLIP